MRVGVLALQGAFAEHGRMLERIGVAAREVRLPADLAGVSAVIIPGGESTTIGKLLDRTGLDDAIRERVAAGMPAWGTCAGMILLARDVGDSGSRAGGEQPLLGLMDLRVRRNAFGGQLDSFETTLAAPAVPTTRSRRSSSGRRSSRRPGRRSRWWPACPTAGPSPPARAGSWPPPSTPS